MTMLWEEYREAHPEGYGYSRFCDLLRGFERRLTPVMRQHHVAGEKAFVDYSGKRVGIVDPSTGEIREAEIFVGVISPLHPHAQALRRSRHRPRGCALCQASALPGARQTAHPRWRRQSNGFVDA